MQNRKILDLRRHCVQAGRLGGGFGASIAGGGAAAAARAALIARGTLSARLCTVRQPPGAGPAGTGGSAGGASGGGGSICYNHHFSKGKYREMGLGRGLLTLAAQLGSPPYSPAPPKRDLTLMSSAISLRKEEQKP
jgi:hypothetical protein